MTITEEEAINAILESPAMPVIADRLCRIKEEEAQRRRKFYDEITPDMKAEFINGQVVMHSPVTVAHVAVSGRLTCLFRTFVTKNCLGWLGVEKAMVSLTRNDFEPNIVFFRQKKAAAFTNDQLLLPAPDFVVEILSPSTSKNERGVKMRDYAAHGVEEYWLVEPMERFVEQYRLGPDKVFVLHEKLHEGMLHCQVLKGLAVPVAAIFDDAENMKAVAAVMSP